MWLCGATVTWIKCSAALGERSWDVFYGPVTLHHSAAQHRPTGALAWAGQGWNPWLESPMGVAGWGTVSVGAV